MSVAMIVAVHNDSCNEEGETELKSDIYLLHGQEDTVRSEKSQCRTLTEMLFFGGCMLYV